jgi:hypothetical protein
MTTDEIVADRNRQPDNIASLGKTAEEQARLNGPALTRLIAEVAELNDRLSPEELDQLERAVMRWREEQQP